MEETNLTTPERITESMKGGLARMYADADIRAYLIHAINIANHNVLANIKLGKNDIARDFAARLDALQQLLDKGKTMYSQAERLRRTPLSELEKQDALTQE